MWAAPLEPSFARFGYVRATCKVLERWRTGSWRARVESGLASAAIVLSLAMIIGVISDTHGLLRPEAVAALQGSDRIIHAGDVGAPEVLTALAPSVAGFSVVVSGHSTVLQRKRATVFFGSIRGARVRAGFICRLRLLTLNRCWWRGERESCHHRVMTGTQEPITRSCSPRSRATLADRDRLPQSPKNGPGLMITIDKTRPPEDDESL